MTGDISAEFMAEKARLYAAADRLLQGSENPSTDGKLTQENLLIEAGFSKNQRHLLTGKAYHQDVRKYFTQAKKAGAPVKTRRDKELSRLDKKCEDLERQLAVALDENQALLRQVRLLVEEHRRCLVQPARVPSRVTETVVPIRPPRR